MSSFGEMASAAVPDRHCCRHCCCHWQKGLPACNNVSAYVFSSQREIRSERESVCMCECLCVCVSWFKPWSSKLRGIEPTVRQLVHCTHCSLSCACVLLSGVGGRQLRRQQQLPLLLFPPWRCFVPRLSTAEAVGWRWGRNSEPSWNSTEKGNTFRRKSRSNSFSLLSFSFCLISFLSN